MSIKPLLREILITLCSLFKRDNESKIIFYHDVHHSHEYTPMSTHIELIKSHFEVAKQLGYKLVNSISAKQNQLMVCFDDGFKGIWDNREFFVENSVFPTIFIAVDLIGQDGYLSLDEIKQLSKLGFRFQAHGWSHSDLTQFSKDELHKELYLARIELEHMTGLKIDEVCFPQGYFSDLVVSEARKSGYANMYSSDPKPYYSRDVSDIIPRYLVQHASPSQFKAIVHGGMNVLYKHYYKMHKKQC